jgi:hypothetical protein
MRSHPSRYYGNHRNDERRSNNDSHGLADAESKCQQSRACGPCRIVGSGYDPVSGEALPCPRPPVVGDGDEISIAPLFYVRDVILGPGADCSRMYSHNSHLHQPGTRAWLPNTLFFFLFRDVTF